MLILTHFIAKHELKVLMRQIDLTDIVIGAKKVIQNLAIRIKSPQTSVGFKFFKVRIGKKFAGRMIVFMIVENKKIVPILIRRKDDKIFGVNMSMNNPHVVKQITKNLDRVLQDIQHNHFEEFPLE